jgi:hypothetical protein
MHHYKKIVENFEDEDEDQKEEGFSWLVIIPVVIFIIALVIGGGVFYKRLKRKDIEVYDKLRNPRSREDCFELNSGVYRENKNCLNTWELKNMKPEELITQYGAVRDPVQL